MKQELNYQYDMRDEVRETREREFWIEAIADIPERKKENKQTEKNEQ